MATCLGDYALILCENRDRTAPRQPDGHVKDNYDQVVWKISCLFNISHFCFFIFLLFL